MLVLNSPRLSDADVRRFLPYLHHLSDVLWIVWEQLGEGNLKRLRYCAVEGIRPHDPTGQLISQFFMERRKTDQVSWDRRLTFDILSKEALALLVSPNRPAVARLLIHHAVVVGSRRPVVTIFTSGGKLCMIWDLVPDGADHTFGDVEAPVYCNAKDPPAYCATSEDHIPDWLEWLPQAGFRPAPAPQASSAPPTSVPPPPPTSSSRVPPPLPSGPANQVPPALPPRPATQSPPALPPRPDPQNPPALPPRPATRVKPSIPPPFNPSTRRTASSPSESAQPGQGT
ncbi:MAG: hypothetical protein Q9223_007632 [Gallowayella weberi]